MDSIDIPGEGQTLRLWPREAPMALGNQDADIPSLTFYHPEKPNGAAILCAPGGGFNHLAWEKEGVSPARWLAGQGILGIALKYRVTPYRHPAPFLDFARAVRTVRANAAHWKLDPKRIGVLGFSAGGFLSAMLSTRFDAGNSAAADPIERVSSRPDLCVLLYAGTSLRIQEAHRPQGNNQHLLGTSPSEELMDQVCNEKHVTPQTPPTFFFNTVDDGSVPVENALVYGSALRKAGVSFEMHLFQHGRHGVGLATTDTVLGVWPSLCTTWLREQGFVGTPR